MLKSLHNTTHVEQRRSITLWMLPQYFIYDEGKCNKQVSKHRKQEPRAYNKVLESSPNYLHTVASYDYYDPCPKYEECI